ncbi:Homeotic protein spalt-major [Habropoda laboriosa]|uniref:Homeotic protein spalt-major n=1 Tax=Habropoda laboriosa TaxID=597456 RepID=A0A0L7R163_9HYME|nr:Homeotic protein spalt-major [Habropoda laboriosa]
MQLMRWSITRRLECRGIKQGTCRPSRLSWPRSSGEENDFMSDGEESGGGGAGGDEAVDLTASRSHQGDEDDKDQEDGLEEDEEEGVDEQDDQEEDEEGSRKQIRHRQDAENNNNFVEGGAPAGLFPPAGTSHVTLEALQNTKVAVAQFAATALAGGADSEAALQDLALLQSTLYTLQHQQVFQLQLISQLQQQLSITHGQSAQQQVTGEPSDSKEISPSPIIQAKPLSSLTSPPSSRPPSHQQTTPPPMTPNLPQERPTPTSSASPLSLPLASSNTTGTTATTSSSSQVPMSHQMPPLCSISSSLASSIITNTDPPPLHEPNTLEMLQKRAQEVLDNASQGLLANNLADELAFRGGKGSRLSPYDSKSGSGRGEPFFKHRCRYCGKVFGSDSALQIHIRSHTGERPFKCNVCGSRFTTKGNLKVHFQRHTAKFPHVKMNPNPVPEHLDKYHPPLLQQIASGQRPMPSPPPPPPSHHPSFHPAAAHGFLPPQPPLPLSLALPGMPPLYRSPVVAHRDDQDVPENLSKPITTAPTTSPHSPAVLSNSRHSFHDNHQQQKQQLEQRDEIKLEQRSPMQEPYQQRPTSQEATERITPKKEPEEAEEPTEEESEDFEETTRRYLNSPQSSANPPSQPQTYEDCSMDSKISGRLEGDADMEVDEEIEEQPENLSSRGTINRLPQHVIAYPGASPASSSASSGSLQTSFAGILFPGPPAHHQIPHHTGSTAVNTAAVSTSEMIDPAKDPAIYSSLLPRPGSNDNSWESLIEITKTSETSKLQQLVDNIEHKLTDPNQCVICHRVLSCKSALQMHYRTHTGERPFKCKICGRAFTTKGNLKTHMGVHRAKPPLRVLHQCPVCHKKFTNALVLQQHIRLHTGEPTELSPEQIQAGEVNEFPPGYPHHPLASFLPQGFPPIHPTGAGFPLGFPPTRQQTLERHPQENDVDVKDEPHQQHQRHHQHQQQQQQQQRYTEEHSEEADDQDDEDEDRREEDERCDVNRDSRVDVEDEQDRESDENEHKDVCLPSFSTSLAALENQVRTITTTATSTVGNMARSPLFHRYNGSEKSNSPPNAGAPLDLTPRASSTPASVASVPTPPPQATVHHPHPFGMFAGLLQAVSSSPSSNSIGTSSINSLSSMNAATPGGGTSGPLASLTTSAVLAATSTYNPLGLAVGGPAGRRC